MKLSFLILAGIIFTLTILYFSGNYFEFDVSAQPENRILNNTQGNQNSNNVKNFESAAIYSSSDTSLDQKKNELVARQNSQNPKIQFSITQILENANPHAIAKLLGAKFDEDGLTSYVYLKDSGKIPPGLKVMGQDQNIIQTKLTLSEIQSLAKLDSIERITLPDYAKFDVIDESEGVQFSLADQLHQAGINGSGVTIAVIDDSFITNNTQISGNIVSQWFASGCTNISCGYSDGNSHGTAVAEIVVDMAPAVNLRLYAIQTSVDFATAVNDAITHNADIITASIGFPSQGGVGWYRDGSSQTAQWVNYAHGNGTLATIASGNDGDRHWSGFYSPIPVNSTDLSGNFQDDMVNLFDEKSVMIFNSTAEGNLKACLPVTNNVSTYTFRWNGYPYTDQDYDPMIYDSTMTQFKTGLLVIQDGSPTSFPVESFTYEGSGDYCIVIASFDSTENALFHIDVGTAVLNIPESDSHRLGSIGTPADATGSLAVGAVSFNSTITNYSDDFLESFSSQGPTDDSRLKPEICGPDRNFTHQTNLNPSQPGTFPGTSAATPHVAGAAALLLQQDPSLTVDQLKQKLVDNARFDADFSVDNKCGSDSGSLQLPLDVSITITKTANGGNAVFDFVTTATDTNLDGNFTGNSGFTINTSTSNSVKFTGLSPAVNYTITESPESGWKFNSISCSGATTSISGRTVTIDPIEAAQITCTYTNTKLPTCTPPGSGNWVITSSCILNSNHTLNGGNVIVQNNSILEIPSGVTLDIDFASHNLTVKSGSGVLIKSGGKIT